jgi:excisionase family DNA binding protein
MEPLLVRPEEAARILALGRSKLYEMLAAGEIGPVIKIGRATRIPVSALHKWMDRQAAATDESQP